MTLSPPVERGTRTGEITQGELSSLRKGAVHVALLATIAVLPLAAAPAVPLLVAPGVANNVLPKARLLLFQSHVDCWPKLYYTWEWMMTTIEYLV